MRPASGTPREAGYAMPAEWERHEATWLAWPHDPITFPDRIPKVERIYLAVMQALAPSERVELLVNDEAARERVRGLCGLRGIHNVRVHVVPTADAWIRDYGPIFVKRGAGGGGGRAGRGGGFETRGGER
ncbi:MAG: agmatine deiminase family protein, partial [Methanobacteriota archaeon]